MSYSLIARHPTCKSHTLDTGSIRLRGGQGAGETSDRTRRAGQAAGPNRRIGRVGPDGLVERARRLHASRG
eukprot:3477153-Pyramimonas_sp.AAC.1